MQHAVYFGLPLNRGSSSCGHDFLSVAGQPGRNLFHKCVHTVGVKWIKRKEYRWKAVLLCMVLLSVSFTYYKQQLKRFVPPRFAPLIKVRHSVRAQISYAVRHVRGGAETGTFPYLHALKW